MKTKKEILQSFLQNIGLWESFANELRISSFLENWDEVDDDLLNLLRTVRMIKESPCCFAFLCEPKLAVANQLENPDFIPELIAGDVFSPSSFRYALYHLYDDLCVEDRDCWKNVRSETSIRDIVEQAYYLQRD